MLHLRITAPTDLTDALADPRGRPGREQPRPLRGASVRPAGDLVLADVAREARQRRHRPAPRASACTTRHRPRRAGATWLSQAGFDAERRTPGSSADAVVWAEVTQRAYEESELNWTYLSLHDAGDPDRRRSRSCSTRRSW